eukprot:scaffold4607_cov39-Cyclotella_meneghiniana.AAC.9
MWRYPSSYPSPDLVSMPYPGTYPMSQITRVANPGWETTASVKKSSILPYWPLVNSHHSDAS